MGPPDVYSGYEVKDKMELKDVSKKLQETPGHMVVVVDDNKVPIGLVTQTDLVKRIGLKISLDPSIEVEKIMNRDFVRISEDKTVDAALSLMNSLSVNKLVVLTADGKFKGVLHKLDIIREARELL